MKKIYSILFLLSNVNFSPAQQAASIQSPYYSNPNFFPICVWAQAPYDVQTYKKMGVNVYMGLDWQTLDASQLATLHQYKMYVFPSVGDTFALHHISDTLIYGWLLTDEPDNAQWNAITNTYDSCINPSVIIHQYDSIKLTDTIHPIYFGLDQSVAYTDWVGRGPCYAWTASYPVYDNGYLKGNDIGGYDIYPINNTDATTSGNLWYVAKGIDSLLLWSSLTASPRVPSKPIWMSLETTKITTSSAAGPTPAQTKSEVWMSIIHGAKGINYFPDAWNPNFTADALLQNAAMVNTLTTVDSMIHVLAPVINSSNIGYATNTNINTSGVSSSNGAVPINYMIKTYNGSTYIFAVAMRTGTTTATFTVTSGSTVTVLGENRNINISGGVFTDNFAADYQVHLYKIAFTTSVINIVYQMPDINIYPNPVNSFATIEILNGTNYPYNVVIADLQGKIIYEVHELYGQKAILNRNGVSRGMYLCYLKDKNNAIIGIRKIVIE